MERLAGSGPFPQVEPFYLESTLHYPEFVFYRSEYVSGIIKLFFV